MLVFAVHDSVTTLYTFQPHNLRYNALYVARRDCSMTCYVSSLMTQSAVSALHRFCLWCVKSRSLSDAEETRNEQRISSGRWIIRWSWQHERREVLYCTVRNSVAGGAGLHLRFAT
jgi:hypothetical protein